MRQFLLFILFLSFSQFMFADDDIMITRDGEEREVKIDRITVKEVVFTDLKKKKRGKQSLPTNFVYLIKTDKRGNIFFNEEGNQITRPKKKIDKKDEVVYLLTSGMRHPKYFLRSNSGFMAHCSSVRKRV